MNKIVLATGNVGKVREIATIFSSADIEILPQSAFGIESPEETGTTFVENALLKAQFAANQSQLPAMADDSGIVVDALEGRPGVYSARYAGVGASDNDNLDLLIKEMRDVPDDARTGRFCCAAVVAFPGDEHPSIVVEEAWEGTILRERRGDGGFGYDPVFLDPASGKTGAELTREEKNVVSHRGKAFRKILELVADLSWP